MTQSLPRDAAESTSDKIEMEMEMEMVEELPLRLAEQAIGLFNVVIASTDILGFQQALEGEAARAAAEDLQQSVNAGRKWFFAIRQQNALVGMGLVTPNTLPNCAHVAELSKGIIRPDLRGGKILRNALAGIARHCLARGIEILTLDVREHSNAHQLWVHIGFREYGRLPDYARTNGVTHAGIYMFIRAEQLL